MCFMPGERLVVAAGSVYLPHTFTWGLLWRMLGIEMLIESMQGLMFRGLEVSMVDLSGYDEVLVQCIQVSCFWL